MSNLLATILGKKLVINLRFKNSFINRLCISQFHLRPAPPPRADPRALTFFLPWMANSRGWGLLSCQIPRGGDEKRGQMPCPPSTHKTPQKPPKELFGRIKDRTRETAEIEPILTHLFMLNTQVNNQSNLNTKWKYYSLVSYSVLWQWRPREDYEYATERERLIWTQLHHWDTSQKTVRELYCSAKFKIQ